MDPLLGMNVLLPAISGVKTVFSDPWPRTHTVLVPIQEIQTTNNIH